MSNWCLEDFMMEMDDQGYPLGDALDPFGLDSILVKWTFHSKAGRKSWPSPHISAETTSRT